MAKGAVKYYDDISGTWKYLMQGPRGPQGPKGDPGLGIGDMEKSVYDPAGKDRQLAADNEVVKLTGDQTIAGVKTFSSSPVVPTPTTSGQAATKGYVDGGISAHTSNTSNPHSVTKAQVGLGSVPNLDTTTAVSQTHTHSNKATLDATTASYTSAEKTKLSGIETGAQVNTVASVAGKTGAVTLVKADVGLGNVDNTSNATERASTATLTNKRINPRVSSTASASSITPNINTYDHYMLTALAANLTINAPGGTSALGNKIMFYIKDNGTSRTISWAANYKPIGVTLPTATTPNKVMYVGMVCSAIGSGGTIYDVIAVAEEA